MSDRAIVFHHIPKTAGTTIYSILEKQYKLTDRFCIDGMRPVTSLQQFRSFSMQERDKFRLIYGHLADRFIPLLERKPLYIVFLREPIDHFISSFYYIQRSAFNRFHQQVKSISIENFIEMRWKEGLDNLQTRHVSGDTDFTLNDGQVPTDSKTQGEVLLAKAKERLEKADFVLLTEYFDESVLILYKELQWKSKPYYKVKNKTKNRPLSESFPAEVLTKIEDVCRLDIQLYEFGKQCFFKRFDLADNAFQKDIRKFQRTNKLINFFSI